MVINDLFLFTINSCCATGNPATQKHTYEVLATTKSDHWQHLMPKDNVNRRQSHAEPTHILVFTCTRLCLLISYSFTPAVPLSRPFCFSTLLLCFLCVYGAVLVRKIFCNEFWKIDLWSSLCPRLSLSVNGYNYWLLFTKDNGYGSSLPSEQNNSNFLYLHLL